MTSKLGFGEAFAKFGAKLKNPQWSVCAEAPDGALVVSCWAHYFEKAENGVIRYTDFLDRWKGHGNNELRERIGDAFHYGQKIRAVIATTDNTAAVDAGGGASKIKKTFSVRKDWIGKVVEFDGRKMVIQFKRQGP